MLRFVNNVEEKGSFPVAVNNNWRFYNICLSISRIYSLS